MIVQYLCTPKGVITTTVIDRQQNQCSDVAKMTQTLGREMSHEVTGPECPATEVQVETETTGT